jgi:hypothetical protein
VYSEISISKSNQLTWFLLGLGDFGCIVWVATIYDTHYAGDDSPSEDEMDLGRQDNFFDRISWHKVVSISLVRHLEQQWASPKNIPVRYFGSPLSTHIRHHWKQICIALVNSQSTFWLPLAIVTNNRAHSLSYPRSLLRFLRVHPGIPRRNVLEPPIICKRYEEIERQLRASSRYTGVGILPSDIRFRFHDVYAQRPKTISYREVKEVDKRDFLEEDRDQRRFIYQQEEIVSRLQRGTSVCLKCCRTHPTWCSGRQCACQ